jgi:putative addiction module component (TIGR02574 family)
MSQPIRDFRTLPIAERIQLVEDIWDSIASESPESLPLTPSQRAEVRRRVEAHDADPASSMS